MGSLLSCVSANCCPLCIHPTMHCVSLRANWSASTCQCSVSPAPHEPSLSHCSVSPLLCVAIALCRHCSVSPAPHEPSLSRGTPLLCSSHFCSATCCICGAEHAPPWCPQCTPVAPNTPLMCFFPRNPAAHSTPLRRFMQPCRAGCTPWHVRRLRAAGRPWAPAGTCSRAAPSRPGCRPSGGRGSGPGATHGARPAPPFRCVRAYASALPPLLWAVCVYSRLPCSAGLAPYHACFTAAQAPEPCAPLVCACD